ncbi:restriction endonuclease [Segatella copri]|uniref:restriction endonuclease n=1 Tax=Segatella copri TaxID=165179 RepID=UPI0029167243|nr:restriction endonuclease [Segatella copri]MDV3121069.1 restriction endonuclease [Segatella copri]
MRILIEEYQYNVSDVHDVLYGIDPMENVEGKVSIHYVGYYYNPLLGDCVFILPKVLLRDVDGKELAFGKYLPYDIINPEGQEKLTKDERDFLYGFAVWIYRAIVVYKNDKSNDSTIVYQKMINQVGGSSKRKSNTFLDILLSLIQFNKDNKSFFFFVLKNLHSGLNKINWTRTISTTSAIIQGGDAIYLNPVNKKRKINFDEELLVIFFSILNYIGDTYGFPKEINCNFDLIKGKQFEKYRNGYGKVRLNQIKYKYFSDKALQLWKLCYAFFDKSHHIYVNTSQKEYLLVKSFHIVFEAIIDALVGDNPLPDGMDKKQEDGKIVDHLFTAKSLINDESSNTYYIGDSKYYKMGNELGKESIYKQYTYARNVIQWNLDIFNSGRKPESGIKLRDDETEGYNIIPNFFISATMDEKFRYAIDGIKETDRKNNRYISKQFQNRLFDRDTLLLFHYDVNFLFVVALYGRNGQGEKKVWRDKVRKMFRKEIQQMLNSKFDFYAVTAKEGVSGVEYIQDHFQQLLGKIFTPYDDRGTQRYYSLALDNGEQFAGENATILSQLKDSFYVVPCKLGDDPKTLLPEVAPLAEGIQVPSSFLTMHYLERYLDKTILVGCYHDEAHLNWILGKNDKGTLIYNIRVGKEREGGQIKAHLDKMVVSFVVLYEYGHEHENKYRVFHVHHHAYIKEDRMRETLYPSEPKGNYFCYVFDEEVTLGKLDVQRLISQKRIDDREYVDGAPIFMTGKELIKFRK